MGIFFKFLPTREEIDRKSFEEGKFVSGCRRLTIFLLDLFIYIFITILTSIFIENKYLSYITFIIYYALYPYIKNGQTMGSYFLQVRLEFNNYKFIKILLRNIFLFTYYFGIPIALMFIIDLVDLSSLIKVWIYLISPFIIGLFYLINILLLIITKKMFYDHLFQVNYINTIKNEL